MLLFSLGCWVWYWTRVQFGLVRFSSDSGRQADIVPLIMLPLLDLIENPATILWSKPIGLELIKILKTKPNWPFPSFPSKLTIITWDWRQTLNFHQMKEFVISQKFDSCNAAKYSVIDSTVENVLWEKQNQRKEVGATLVTDNTPPSDKI